MLLLLVLVGNGMTAAAQESRGPQRQSEPVIETRQPNGTSIKLRCFGSIYETLDGYLVSPKGPSYVYAKRLSGGRLSATNLMVGVDATATGNILPRYERLPMQAPDPTSTERPKRRTKPLVGTYNVLVLRLRFSDHKDRNVPTTDQLYRLFKESGKFLDIAPHGTVKDYSKEVSYGQLKVRAAIGDWIDLPQTEAYYAEGLSDGSFERLHEALTYALDYVDRGIANGDIPPKLADFDGNGDGFVDAVSFIHSGYGGAFRTTTADGAKAEDRIRSHRFLILPTWKSSTGFKVGQDAIHPGLAGVGGQQPTRLAVICHEGTHLGGLPDLYDVNYTGAGIGG
ncbi:MAG: hypothetical protein CMJ78_26195 [Planctomycetaceae bacterium]|nr:hypothetical protein [Planctomycetaceae bacterium]